MKSVIKAVLETAEGSTVIAQPEVEVVIHRWNDHRSKEHKPGLSGKLLVTPVTTISANSPTATPMPTEMAFIVPLNGSGMDQHLEALTDLLEYMQDEWHLKKPPIIAHDIDQ